MVEIPYVEKHKAKSSCLEPYIQGSAVALGTENNLLMGSVQGDLSICFLHGWKEELL